MIIVDWSKQNFDYQNFITLIEKIISYKLNIK